LLRQRLILGPILIVLLLSLAWLEERFGTGPRDIKGMIILPLGAIACGLGAWELARILREGRVHASSRVTIASAITGYFITSLAPVMVGEATGTMLVATGAVVAMLAGLGRYARDETFDGAIASIGGTMLAYVYLGIMLGFFGALRQHYSMWVIVWIILTTKSCDIGAYFAGRWLGSHKLIPWLSPKKTWEGLIGGMLFSGLIGACSLYAVNAMVNPGLPFDVLVAAVLGGVFGLVGQGGDLIASLFKRDAGRKDASRVIPGLGGVLDVLDSLLLVAPLAYWVFARWPVG